LQGPRVHEFINQCFPGKSTGGTEIADVRELKKNQIARFAYLGRPIWISRTGYTGEDGFEIVAPSAIIADVWSHIMRVGHPYCLQPAGLGARDTLRTEVCYPLYGHELDEQTTPIEAGVGFFVSFDKGEFVGRPVLADQKANGVKRKCVAFKMTGKSAPPRPDYTIWSSGSDGAQIGKVVSGTQSPSLSNGIGMGYVNSEFAKAGTPIEIEVRGKRSAAVIVPKPIYKKPV
jgi:aminomethyltransferase